MDLQGLITKLQEIENRLDLSEAAPTQFTPTHFHLNNLGFRTSVMLHSDGKFYHMRQGQYPNQGRQEIARWNGDPENRSAWNPASIDGEYVNGEPVEYPEGITYKTFNKDSDEPVDTLPTDDEKKTSNYTGQDQKTPELPTTTTHIVTNPPAPQGQAPRASEVDEITNHITTASRLLDKAEGKQSYNPISKTFQENIYESLVSSFGYIAEALSDLSTEEQKELKDAMIHLYPYKDSRTDVQQLVSRYTALIKANKLPSTDSSSDTDTILTPDELKQALAKFKLLLDKAIKAMSAKQGVKESQTDIKSLLSKLLEIENTVINEGLSSEEQIELGKLYLKLSHSRYRNNPEVAREIARYESVKKDLDQYFKDNPVPDSNKPTTDPVPVPSPKPEIKPDVKPGTEPEPQPTPAPAPNTEPTLEDKKIAKQLYKAMDGPGTNERLFFKTLEQIQSKQQWINVSKVYKSLYQENLVNAIYDDFSKGEIRKIERMLKKINVELKPTTSKPEVKSDKPEVKSDKTTDKPAPAKPTVTLTDDEKKKIDFAFKNPNFPGVESAVKDEYRNGSKEKRRAVAEYCKSKGYDAKKTFGIDFSKDM